MQNFFIQKYKLKHDKDLCTIILYINLGDLNTEFAEDLGKNDLRKEATNFIHHNFNFIAKKTVKIMMGTTLLATFTLAGALPSFAAGEVSGTTPSQETTISGPTTTTEPTTTTAEATPSLVPGDFFYFVKILVEKIQVALTFDDVAKAEKLADFAGERIAEARVLIANGDPTGAADLLNKALETQELALNYSSEGELDATVPTTDAQGQLTNEEQALLQTRDQIKGKFGNNILALLGALQNVKNPQAQASLTKNIEKSFNKLETKLGEFEQKQAKKESKTIPEQIANLENNVQKAHQEETLNNGVDEATQTTITPLISAGLVKKAQQVNKGNTSKSPSVNKGQSKKQNQVKKQVKQKNAKQTHESK